MIKPTIFQPCGPLPHKYNVRLGNFLYPSEFACQCGCGTANIHWLVWYCCQQIRDKFGPVIINSACRCYIHNQMIGGSPDSDHSHNPAWAADIAVPGTSSLVVASFAETLDSIKRIGTYYQGGRNGENGFCHVGVVDRGPGSFRRWRVNPNGTIIESIPSS